jgi:hypothetical protein
MMTRSWGALVATAGCTILLAAQPVRAQHLSGSFDRAAATVSQADSTGSTFLTAGMAQGQQPPPPPGGNPRHEGIGIGVKGGFLWPSFAEAQGTGFKDKTSWMAGVFFGGNRPGTIGVMGEVQYGKKSASLGNIDAEQYFLEIPILARINAGANSLNGLLGYFMVGPVFDINLKTKLRGVDVKSAYEDLDIGLLIAGGVEITRFLVEARYNRGFKNVLKSTGGRTTDIKSESFAIQLGFRFN